MKPLYACLLLSACATASHEAGGDDTQLVDAGERQDSSFTPVDGGPDAPTQCTVNTRNLLANSDFDGTPLGTDWNATPIDPAYPLIGDNTSGGIAAQSGANRAWMGGLERPSASNRDVLFQDVQVPAGTTVLELKGYYDLRTTEFVPGVFDSATIELTTQQNVQLELVQTIDDDHATTAWTPFAKTFTGTYAGMTVRVRFSSASDSTDPTSFYFDTVELNATFCQ
jgi:hypothetical protein